MSRIIFNNNKEINSVFSLVGEKEDDITKSIIWLLKDCPILMERFLCNICKIEKYDKENIVMFFQEFEKVENENSFTNIEITDNENFHIIIEAKRGWILPGEAQLTKYSLKDSFVNNNVPIKRIFSISECSQDYANKYLPFKTTKNGVSVNHITWQEFVDICKESARESVGKQRYIINEFLNYIGGIMRTPNNTSNQVFVVALNRNETDTKGITYVDVVEKGNKYFCPVSWFKNQVDIPNYIGFRYDGKLKYIMHIDSYIITRNFHDVIEFMDDIEMEEEAYVFSLGKRVEPLKEVRTGGVYPSGHNWADIDLLLTCDTVKEAVDLSKSRHND